MSNKNLHWWWIILPLMAVALILVAVFWNTVMIYCAPKAVLTKALTDTAHELEERFRLNPLRNVMDLYSPQGQYTASLELTTVTDKLGEVVCDLNVHTDAVNHQLLAEGTINFSNTDLDLSLYLNQDYMAVSSQDLVKGAYYGVTYDTFLEDMDRFPLIKAMIPKNTLSAWLDSLENIQALMRRSYEVPQISTDNLHLLLAGILLLDCDVSRGEWRDIDCYQITCSASGPEIQTLLGYVLETTSSVDAQIISDFYLFEQRLIGFQLQGIAGENMVVYSLDLGEMPMAPLHLTEKRVEGGQERDTVLSMQTEVNGPVYQETIRWNVEKDESEDHVDVSYSWNSNNGDMILSWNQEMPVQLNLKRNQQGLQIITEDFAYLLKLLQKREGIPQKDISGILILSPGAPLEAPSFMNLDRWSTQDLLTLLKGLGNLLGIPI